MSDETTKMVIFDPSSMDEKALAEQKARLERLAAMPDEEIDLSDIPETTDEQWRLAFRPGLHRPIKFPVTIRLDADVVTWFKAQAGDSPYQTEMNRVLREHMVAKTRLTATKKKADRVAAMSGAKSRKRAGPEKKRA